jgi:hypothetical protein
MPGKKKWQIILKANWRRKDFDDVRMCPDSYRDADVRMPARPKGAGADDGQIDFMIKKPLFAEWFFYRVNRIYCLIDYKALFYFPPSLFYSHSTKSQKSKTRVGQE